MWISIIDQIKYLEKIFWASSKLLWRAIKFVMAVLPCCLHLLCPISFLSNNFYLLPSIFCIFVFSFIRSIYSYGKLKPKFYINNFHIYRERSFGSWWSHWKNFLLCLVIRVSPIRYVNDGGSWVPSLVRSNQGQRL